MYLILEELSQASLNNREARPQWPRPPLSCVQELRAANETLLSLQKQLELVPSPSSSTIKVLLDTKDARIATLEREVDLLERELERAESQSALAMAAATTYHYPPTYLPLSTGFQSYPSAITPTISQMVQPILPQPAPLRTHPSLPSLLHPTTPTHLEAALPSATTQQPRPTTPLKRQVSFLLNDVQVGKDGTVIGRL